MSIARQHAEWLSLIEVSGPFLTMPVLLNVFPQGLEKDDQESELRRILRMAYDEWADNQSGVRPDPAIHLEWLRFTLANVLEMPREVLVEGQALPSVLRAYMPEHGETLLPDVALISPDNHQPRLLIKLYPPGQDLDKSVAGLHWKASPATRMMELLRHTGVRLGLVTNGERWMLVDAPANETTGFASWYAALWLEEPITLRAFRSLLSVRRFFGVPDDETLEAMLTKSASNQQEVTDQLGYQVRRAVEMLVQSLDSIDKDRNRKLLSNVSETDLYEAALTVMMRLVFLLSAEERGLLLLGELLYDRNYAVSTLQAILRDQAELSGEEVLERRHDAWSRLLAIFRVVYGGIEYQDMRLPAYGGHLFDPDRYPFLEGRAHDTSWHDTMSEPLAINNRTVLHLLEALQFLQVKVPGGGPTERRRLSFRALDIEQIGHVYEGLLDHTARRAKTPMLGLFGSIANESEVALDTLEELATKSEQDLATFLEEKTGRTSNAIKNALTISPMPRRFSRADLMAACDSNQALFERIVPFAGFLRTDTFDKPVVITTNSVYVTQGSDRRTTGTHYTPRSLTEPIVQHTLDPLVYSGPAEGKPQEEWQLRLPGEILALKVCDMAMGSGAFLVQVCRYLSEKLVEAWENAEQALPGQPQITPEGLPSTGALHETLLPRDSDERLAIAMRLVSERCIYGVDKNPLAVEMAKLSLWLITLNKNRPFTFLDHALRSGDSLLGVNLRQLTTWSMDNSQGTDKPRQMVWFEPAITRALDIALKLRRQISAMQELDVHDIEVKARLLAESEDAMELVSLGADLLIATALSDTKRRDLLEGTIHVRYTVLVGAFEDGRREAFTEAHQEKLRQDFMAMRVEVDELLKGRKPFHWPLEFPEVFVGDLDEAGFAAVVGNPPFQGGSLITGALGTEYRDYLVKYLARGKRGLADLCAYFFLRLTDLVQKRGMSGLLATKTIAQGDTLQVGLDQMLSAYWTIPRAISSQNWPGEATVKIACIWFMYGRWNGLCLLDDNIVPGITAYLNPMTVVQGKPYPLTANSDKIFKGVSISSGGFILEQEEAISLIEKNNLNREVIFPYLSADDLNSRFDQSPSRWVINFQDWSLEHIQTAYSDCFQIVKERVKPTRDLNTSSKNLHEKWWQYERRRIALYSAIANFKRILVIPRHTKYMICVWVSIDIIHSDAVCVFATDANAHYALIQSTFHDDWARIHSSSLGETLRYTPSKCFETFPFPDTTQKMTAIGEYYDQNRQAIMFARREGLTQIYNRFHNPYEHAPDIVKLRELHKEMDEVVAHAYGWDDLDFGHGFHETKQGLRYTISEEARREVLDRLLKLNHERYAEEVALGLHEKGAKKGKGKKKQESKDPDSRKDEDRASHQAMLLFE